MLGIFCALISHVYVFFGKVSVQIYCSFFKKINILLYNSFLYLQKCCKDSQYTEFLYTTHPVSSTINTLMSMVQSLQPILIHNY